MAFLSSNSIEGKKVILLIAKTQTGKTSLRKILAKQTDDMVSIEKEEFSGNYCFYDGDKDIGSAGVSKTKGLSTHKMPDEEGVIFCDCPGFNDMDGGLAELKQVCELLSAATKASHLKIVFIVDHHHVEASNCLIDFLNLIEYAVGLLAYPEKYKPAVCLVVTKVPNRFKDGILINDETVLDCVEIFLKTVSGLLRGRDELNLSNESMRKEYADFVDGLLEKKHFALFRRPDEEGAVSLIPTVKKCRDQLISFFKKMRWVEPKPEDLCLVLCDKAKSELEKRTHELSETILKEFKSIASFTKEKITESVRDKTPQDALSVLQQHAKCDWLMSDPSDSFKQHSERLNSRCKECSEVPVETYSEKLKELEEIKIAVPIVYSGIHSEIQEQEKSLANFFRGWESLLAVYSELCLKVWSYEVQADQDKYVKDLLGLGLQEKDKNLTIHDIINCRSFVSNLRGHLREQPPMKDELFKEILESKDFEQPMYDFMKDWVIGLLNEALKVSPKLESCMDREATGMTVTVSGSCLVLSKVLQKIQNRSHCRINMFAWDTLFIDCDVDATGKEWKLTMLAPRWHVVKKAGTSNYTISLDGRAGTSHKEPANAGGQGAIVEVPTEEYTLLEKLIHLFDKDFNKVKSYPGEEGAKGHPGSQGGPAGSFFGAGLDFQNTQNILCVSACGGAGSPGQNGGDGGTGASGGKPLVTFLGIKGHRERRYEPQEKLWFPGFYTQVVLYEGLEGGDGGKEGEGGEGGDGGSAGQVIITKAPSGIEIKTSKGEKGQNGSSGARGKRGQKGNTIKGKSTWFLFLPILGTHETEEVASKGAQGTDSSGGSGGSGGNETKVSKQAGTDRKGMEQPQGHEEEVVSGAMDLVAQYTKKRGIRDLKFLQLTSQELGKKFMEYIRGEEFKTDIKTKKNLPEGFVSKFATCLLNFTKGQE